jgi:peptidoglycan/xylan/chitin deacetylase (PgdA/CDA1 family)
MGIKRRLASIYYPDAGVRRYAKRLNGRQGIILMYHEVLPAGASPPAWTVVKADDFAWQTAYLRRHFDLVSIDEAWARVSGAHPADRPFASITFDDGYSGNLHYALPLMKRHNIPFTVYVSTKAVQDRSLNWYDFIINLMRSPSDIIWSTTYGGDKKVFRIASTGPAYRRWGGVQALLAWLKAIPEEHRKAAVADITAKHTHLPTDLRMLTPLELSQLASCPLAAIGCHTHAHDLLDHLDDAAIRASVLTANRLIEEWVGTTPRHFSYPNGNFDGRITAVIRDLQFQTAVTTEGRHCGPADAGLALPRIGIGRFDNRNIFKAKLASQL